MIKNIGIENLTLKIENYLSNTDNIKDVSINIKHDEISLHIPYITHTAYHYNFNDLKDIVSEYFDHVEQVDFCVKERTIWITYKFEAM